MDTRIDHIVDGIYRISTWHPLSRLTFNQFLIADERPALIHTGEYGDYDGIRKAISTVLDPTSLAFLVLLHWEGDENGGMDRFKAEAPAAELVGSALSIQLNAHGFGITDGVRGFKDGEKLALGRHTLRFLETPHVHHWDSMMVIDEQTDSLFPSDLFLQPGEQPALVTENLADAMCATYRGAGIFAHEAPVRRVVDRLVGLDPAWIHAMHGGTLTREVLPKYVSALHAQEFAYRGMLLGRQVETPTIT